MCVFFVHSMRDIVEILKKGIEICTTVMFFQKKELFKLKDG